MVVEAKGRGLEEVADEGILLFLVLRFFLFFDDFFEPIVVSCCFIGVCEGFLRYSKKVRGCSVFRCGGFCWHWCGELLLESQSFHDVFDLKGD